MDFSIFGRGWLLGLAIAAPVGPIGILCIKRSLTQGWRFGLASGLGAATADGIYGCIAGFGLIALSQFLVEQQFWLRLVGGLFLIYLSIRAMAEAWASQTADKSSATENQPGQPNLFQPQLLAAYGSTLALTLTNPVTILSFAAIFAGVGATTTQGNAGWLISGVFCGSASWWLLLCSGVCLLRKRVSATQMRWVSGISAGILGVFGLGAIASLFR